MNTEQAVDPREAAPRPGATIEEFLDLEFEAFCTREGDDDVTLEEVRKSTSRIPESMAQTIIEDERADRF